MAVCMNELKDMYLSA